MKISIFGAGNVGSLAAMHLAQDCLGDIIMIDVAEGLAKGKALDLEDARFLLKSNYNIEGTSDFTKIKGSDVVVITAGLARRPGMTREELLLKNSDILKELAAHIRNLAPSSVVVVVTNPLDLMTYLVLKETGFKKEKVLGMGISLDASRFANIISHELGVSVNDIDALVIGSHGEAMLPLPGKTKIKGKPLSSIVDKNKVDSISKMTINRGAQIVAALGTGSAFFAPSVAIVKIVRAIVLDERKVLGACAYLDGEYGIKDVCIGVPCVLGKNGIEDIVELDLTPEESDSFKKSAASIKELIKSLPL